VADRIPSQGLAFRILAFARYGVPSRIHAVNFLGSARASRAADGALAVRTRRGWSGHRLVRSYALRPGRGRPGRHAGRVRSPRNPIAWLRLGALLALPAAASAATNALSTAPAQFADIKGPLDIRSPGAWIRIALLLLAAGGVLAALWWWWRRRPEPSQGPGESPSDRARKRLTAALDLRHDPERFATRVSEIVRLYLEERFGLHAPDRTTEEFLAELKTSVALESGHKALLGDFLTNCDLAKFARAEPGPAELDGLHEAAMRLVEETAPRVMTPPPVAPATGGGGR